MESRGAMFATPDSCQALSPPNFSPQMVRAMVQRVAKESSMVQSYVDPVYGA